MSNQSLPPTNLASAFAAPTTALRLPGKPPAKPAGPEQAVPTPVQETKKKTKEDLQTHAPPRATPKKPAATTDGRVVISLEVSLHARMRQQKGRTGATFAEQILAALEENAGRLNDLVQRGGPQVQKGPLFEREIKQRGSGESKTHITVVGITSSQRTIIDKLVHDTAAPSRSALITAALDHWLPPQPMGE